MDTQLVIRIFKSEGAEREMKKLQGILLVSIIIGSTFGSLSMIRIAHMESVDLWPGTDVNGDGKTDLNDAIRFLADHFIRFDEQSESKRQGLIECQDWV